MKFLLFIVLINTILGSFTSQTQSRSLPPSPQRTPSRKQSLIGTNPFNICQNALDEIQNQQEASETINKLLEHIISFPADENLMDAAKESGKQLYANMPHDDKVEKINLMVLEATFKSITK